MPLNGKVFDKSYDVIVAGLGTAGAVALIAAAKKGLKVLGIETLSAMGGIGTLGAIGSYYFGSKGGIYEETNEKTLQYQETIHIDDGYPRFDTKAFVMEDIALEYGADFLYESRITEVFTEETKVTGICCFTGGKLITIGSKIIIDCTGEAEICHLAGCHTRIGRKFDRQTQTFSNIAIAVKEGKIGGLNKDSGYIDQNNSRDLTKKIINSTAFLLNHKNHISNGTIILKNASFLGIREGRTIIGETDITLEDFFAIKAYDKQLFYTFCNIDNHGKDTAFEEEVLLDWYTAAGLWGVYFSVGIPLGALIPKGFDGILVAGRCLAAEHNIAPAIRAKRDMEKCGEAAAMMAYLSINDQVALKDVDYDKLSKLLTETKCLDASNNLGFANRVAKNVLIPFQWLTDTNDIIAGLNSISPGIAIWSAKQAGCEIIPALEKCLESKDLLLRKNAAIALGLLGDAAVCNVLRDIVDSRDAYIPASSIKFIYTHTTSAIYLLGKLRDKTATEVLLNVIRTEGAFDSETFIPDEFHSTKDDVRFQHISYALVALSKIAHAFPELNNYIRDNINKKLMDSDFTINISLKSNPNIKYNMTEKLRAYARASF